MSLVIITGSTGLVGSEAVSFFCNKGFDVVGIDNNLRKFFFGREGNRTIQEIRGKNILTKEVYVKDCFQTLFEKNNQYWVDTQITRNRDMLNNLSSLENLSKQYNDI